MPAAEKVKMQMKNGLPRIRPDVGHDAIAVCQPFTLGEVVRHAQAFRGCRDMLVRL